MTTERRTVGDHLHLLDYMRFGAAIAVLLFHYTVGGWALGMATSLAPMEPSAVTRYGFFGVHLFFIISGFVILNSARGKTARRFAVSRAVRLLPAFWLSLLITSCVGGLLGHVNGRPVTVGQVLVNATMVPELFGAPLVDSVYWTLLLEVQFYALVFFLMLLGLTRWLGSLMPWWAFAMLAVSLLAPELRELPYCGGFFAFFVGGAIIAEIRHSGLSVLRSSGLAVSFTLSAQSTYQRSTLDGQMLGVPISGVVAVALVGCFYLLALSLCVPQVAALRLPGARRLGSLTYPMYLIHAEIGYIMLKIFATEQNRGWLVGGLTILTLTYAAWVSRVIEHRLSPLWVRCFDKTLGRAVWAVERHRPTANNEPVSKLDPAVTAR